MNKEATVHMLPTEDKTDILVFDDDSFRLETNSDQLHPFHKTCAHLYVTTDEEIKEGDKVYHTELKIVGTLGKFDRKNDYSSYYHIDNLGSYASVKLRKIIATTDPKLRNDIPTLNTMGQRTVYPQLLPRLSQSFIEEYCEQGGIDKVLVEYKPECLCTDSFNKLLECEHSEQADKTGKKYFCDRIGATPKTDTNNCIIIPPVKESLLEECLNAIEFLSDEANTNQYSELIKKIKENL